MTGHSPSWQRLAVWLIAAVIALQVLADVLPRLVVPLVVLAIAAAVLRFIWWYTQL